MKIITISVVCLTCLVPVSASAQPKITIEDAIWSHPSAAVNVKAQLAAACNGKTICEAEVNNLGLPQPNADAEVKTLKITYRCIETTQEPVTTREYLIFRLNCSAPNEPQPTALGATKIKLMQSPIKADGKDFVGLPKGYVECWSHVFDLNSNYASVEMTKVPQSDGSVNYRLDWHLNPPNLGGNAWMDRIYMVGGYRQADPTAKCPTTP